MGKVLPAPAVSWHEVKTTLSFFKIVQNSCCLGNLSEPRSGSDKKLKSEDCRNSANWWVQWSSSSREMEHGVQNFQSLDIPRSVGLAEDKKLLEDHGNNQQFINKGAISWNKTRNEWIGDRTNIPRRRSQESSISWGMTYEDLLSANQPFSQPIPLSEMVDFLVDIWQEEGLYD